MAKIKTCFAIIGFVIAVLAVIVFVTPAIAIISLMASLLNRENPISVFLELSRDFGLSDFFSASKIFTEIKKIWGVKND